MSPLVPAARPTLHFIGVTTGKSSIMQVFPAWAAHLGLDAAISGIDFPLHAPPEAYREAVSFIAGDPLSRGALVTTHKIDLYRACHDLFGETDEYARLMDETSCLSKRDGRLVCHAKDPISSGLAIDGFLPHAHFARAGAELPRAEPPGAELFVLGAGGSAIAITWHLMQAGRGADRPRAVTVSDPDAHRLAEIERIHRLIGSDVPVRYVAPATRADNDAVLARLPPGSLVVNATGLGKDRPGSPLGDGARFPERAIAWDLNYRGDLLFLAQARAQQTARQLQVEDGWSYFLHGWTQVIAEVFAIDLPTAGPAFDRLGEIAARHGGRPGG